MDSFYFSFEKKFRGSPEDITNKLSFYLPLLKNLYNLKRQPLKVLDIGCGRGEFLSLLQKEEILAEGIDINDENIEFCSRKGLKVTKSDALKFLENTNSETYDVITLIQVLEHFNFEYSFAIFKEIFRVLKEDGILIIEIPNIKHPLISSYYFWLDPTHKRPLPYDLVIFMGQYQGFEDIEIYFINKLGNHPKINFYNFMDFINEIGADVSLIFFKEKTLKNKLTILLNSLRERSNINYDQAMSLYNFYMDILMEQLKQDFHSNSYMKSLEKEIFLLRKELTSIYNSKLWRIYRFLSQKKKSIIDKIKNFLGNNKK